MQPYDSKEKNNMTEDFKTEPVADVLICGAGPVGLMLANLLGKSGLNTVVVEKRKEVPEMSMAIGIMPPSLQIMNRMGLAPEFIRKGIQIHQAHVFNDSRKVGSLSFKKIKSHYRFILSLPQHETILILQRRLSEYKNVKLLRGVELIDAVQTKDRVQATVKTKSGRESFSCRYLAGCGGASGTVRKCLDFASHKKDYGLDFLMADFEDTTGWGAEAYLFFTADGSVEAFPLPGKRRRWIILKSDGEDNIDDIAESVRSRTGIKLQTEGARWLSDFHPVYRLEQHYADRRIFLCGDAAHVISPIGGQGMNTGFGDAQFLSEILVRLIKNHPLEKAAERYERCRQVALRMAANHAARGMWLGTRTGKLFSALRGIFLKNLLLRKPLKEILPHQFAMMTIPNSSLAEAEKSSKPF